MGNFVKLNNRKDFISFVDNVRCNFSCAEDWERFFGFALQCDDDGNELETVTDYAKYDTFDTEPCENEYPVMVYHTLKNEFDRFGKFRIEIFDYIPLSKTEELIGIFGTLCDHMVDNGRCDVFCPYAYTKDENDECEAWRIIQQIRKEV